EQEVILAQREGQLLRGRVQQNQELVVRQQVPVAPDQGDVTALPHQRRHRARRRQPHRPRDRRDVFAARAEHQGQSFHRHHIPVSPNEGVYAVREVGGLQRRRGGALGQDRL